MKFAKIVAAAIVAWWNASKEARKPRLYKVLFPERKQVGMKLDWIVGANGQKVKLQAHALDTNTRKISVPGMTSETHLMPLFKNERDISEEKRQQYLLIANSGNQNMLDDATNRIFEEFAALPEGAEVNGDVMAGQLLSTGKVSIAENDFVKEFDYNLAGSQKETLLTTAKWSDTSNSAPLNDINRWKETVEIATGEAPSLAICSRKTFNYIRENVAIKTLLLSTKKSTSDKALKELILEECGVTVEIYSEKFINAAGNSAPVFPDEIFTLLPAANVGYMMYGTTPEEIDLLDESGAKKDILQAGDCGGISVFVRSIDDPVTKSCRASAIMLPSGENLHKIFIATVHS